MNPTRPATPRAIRRAPTLAGLAPCANAPSVVESLGGGYRTSNPRAARRDARTREAIRVDFVRRTGGAK